MYPSLWHLYCVVLFSHAVSTLRRTRDMHSPVHGNPQCLTSVLFYMVNIHRNDVFGLNKAWKTFGGRVPQTKHDSWQGTSPVLSTCSRYWVLQWYLLPTIVWEPQWAHSWSETYQQIQRIDHRCINLTRYWSFNLYPENMQQNCATVCVCLMQAVKKRLWK